MLTVPLWLRVVLKEKYQISFHPIMKKDDFLSITEHNELAGFFGITYQTLTRIIYKTDDSYKY